MVMGDVNGDVTTVLERAAITLKDDRLVPKGFSTNHAVYDTTRIEGVPASDIDFNRDALNVEGNGGDIVHYHVPLNGYGGPISVKAHVWFQPVPPRWNAEMFGRTDRVSIRSAPCTHWRTARRNWSPRTARPWVRWDQ